MGLTRKKIYSLEELSAFRAAAVRQGAAKPSVREGGFARVLRRIKHALFVDLYYPNIWLLIGHALARSLRHHGRVLVMGSSPPFSMAVAGAVLRLLRPSVVVLAIDMRDAWAMHLSLGGARRAKLTIDE